MLGRRVLSQDFTECSVVPAVRRTEMRKFRFCCPPAPTRRQGTLRSSGEEQFVHLSVTDSLEVLLETSIGFPVSLAVRCTKMRTGYPPRPHLRRCSPSRELEETIPPPPSRTRQWVPPMCDCHCSLDVDSVSSDSTAVRRSKMRTSSLFCPPAPTCGGATCGGVRASQDRRITP